MLKTGLADPYWNEQYLPKPKWLYDWEWVLINLNAGGPDLKTQTSNLLYMAYQDCQFLLSLLNIKETENLIIHEE